MYRCEICKKIVPANTKAHRITLETRYRRYPVRIKAHRRVPHGKEHHQDDPGGFGYEIVREVIACPECAAQSLSV